MRNDFKLVFKDIMDRRHFEDKVYFRDPITTNLNSFRGDYPAAVAPLFKYQLHSMLV